EGYERTAKKGFTRPLKIGFTVKSPVDTPVSEEAKEAVYTTVKWLEQAGHEVEEVDNGVDGHELMRNYFLMNSGEMATLMHNLESMVGKPITSDDVELETWLLNVEGKNVSGVKFSIVLASREVVAEQMAFFHERYDFYVTRAAVFGAPEIGELTASNKKAPK